MKTNGSTEVGVHCVCVPKAPLVGNKASAPTHSVTTLEYKGAASIGKHTQSDIMAVSLQRETHNSVQICWTLSSLRPHFPIMGAEMEAFFFIPNGAILTTSIQPRDDRCEPGSLQFQSGTCGTLKAKRDKRMLQGCFGGGGTSEYMAGNLAVLI